MGRLSWKASTAIWAMGSGSSSTITTAGRLAPTGAPPFAYPPRGTTETKYLRSGLSATAAGKLAFGPKVSPEATTGM